MRGLPARTSCAALALVALLAACGGEESGELRGLVRDDPLQVGETSITEVTDGAPPAPFSFKASPGELLVVYFGYTNCPDVCPTTLAELRSAEKKLGEDKADKVDLAMVTIDPERDTPEALNTFLGFFADDYHALVAQSDEELQAAQDAFLVQAFVTKNPDGTVSVEHTGNAFVVDDQGAVVDEWAFGFGIDNMVNDLEILLDRM